MISQHLSAFCVIKRIKAILVDNGYEIRNVQICINLLKSPPFSLQISIRKQPQTLESIELFTSAFTRESAVCHIDLECKHSLISMHSLCKIANVTTTDVHSCERNAQRVKMQIFEVQQLMTTKGNYAVLKLW